MDKYILDEKGESVFMPDFDTWGEWYDKAERRVGLDLIGTSEVSTVFLGMDYGFDLKAPVLWETMVFGGLLDEETDRCSGPRENARKMHANMVSRVKEQL